MELIATKENGKSRNMFLCRECMKEYVITRDMDLLHKSVGLCEHCNKPSFCYDLPHGSYYHKDSPYAQKLRLERGETITIEKAPELFEFVRWQIAQCNDVMTLQKVLKDLVKISNAYDAYTCGRGILLTVDKDRNIY